jgi:adenylate cyclase
MLHPSTDKHSIAVLPFNYISGDPGQEYIADALTENIITAISRVPGLFVVSRSTVFNYKDKSLDIKTISKDLGVRYVLEGSFQKAKDQIRITAQLIDAITDGHLWSQKFDRPLKDLFALQDEITLKILDALQIKLSNPQFSFSSYFRKGTDNLEAFLKLVEVRKYPVAIAKHNPKIRQLSEEAISLDPEYAMAYAMLGFTHFLDARRGWSNSRTKSIELAFDNVKKAISLDNSLPFARMVLSRIYLVMGEYEKAINEGKLAVQLAPNDSDSNYALAFVLYYAGKAKESIPWYERSIKYNPKNRASEHGLGRAYLFTGQLDEAYKIFQRHADDDRKRNREPRAGTLRHLATIYQEQGKTEEAKKLVEQALKIRPNYSVARAKKVLFYKNPEDLERELASMRKLGIPEHPPLK